MYQKRFNVGTETLNRELKSTPYSIKAWLNKELTQWRLMPELVDLMGLSFAHLLRRGLRPLPWARAPALARQRTFGALAR